MKLTEVSKERTFNLEISESELRDLLSALFYMPVERGESLSCYCEDVKYNFSDMCNNIGIAIPSNRTKFIDSL